MIRVQIVGWPGISIMQPLIFQRWVQRMSNMEPMHASSDVWLIDRTSRTSQTTQTFLTCPTALKSLTGLTSQTALTFSDFPVFSDLSDRSDLSEICLKCLICRKKSAINLSRWKDLLTFTLIMSGFLKQKGSYRKLRVYKVTEIIYDLTFYFCEHYLKLGDRDGAGRA